MDGYLQVAPGTSSAGVIAKANMIFSKAAKDTGFEWTTLEVVHGHTVWPCT